jgi:hypothetical protein
VSLLFPERITVFLGPRAVERLPADMAALRRRTDVTVVLSNHFVRYAVLPEHDGAATPQEELALARFQFARIHGERAKGWEVRVCERLACAIDAAALESIRVAFPRAGKARLVSVQPSLMAGYNRERRRIPREGAWLVLSEAERTCLARLAPQGWASVYNGRETDADELLERERYRAAGDRLPSLVVRARL